MSSPVETVPALSAAETKKTARSERLSFIDWTRGAATLVMLQGHVWESFTHKDLRDTGVYMMSQFPGGVAPGCQAMPLRGGGFTVLHVGNA